MGWCRLYYSIDLRAVATKVVGPIGAHMKNLSKDAATGAVPPWGSPYYAKYVVCSALYAKCPYYVVLCMQGVLIF